MFKLKLKTVTAKLCAELLKYGVPTVINSLAMVVLVFTLNKLLRSTGGNVAVASYSVISTVGNICYCFGSGVASVSLLLSAIFYSDEDRTAIHSLVRTQTWYAVVLDVALVAAVFLLAPVLVSLFLADDPAARALTVRGMRIFCFSLLPCSLNTTFKNYFQGVNHTPFTETISVLQNVVFPLTVAFTLSSFLGTNGVWFSFLGGELLTLIFICTVVWIRFKKPSLSVEAFSMLPKDFGVPDADRIEMTVRTREEAAEASVKAQAFCAGHGESARDSMLISLCVEEMLNNIVTHGFRKGRKDQSADIRILIKGDSRVIRIRDNCRNFDPVSYIKTVHSGEDPAAHIGIRMVMKMVKSANYVNSLGLNNLTLVL